MTSQIISNWLYYQTGLLVGKHLFAKEEICIIRTITFYLSLQIQDEKEMNNTIHLQKKYGKNHWQ